MNPDSGCLTSCVGPPPARCHRGPCLASRRLTHLTTVLGGGCSYSHFPCEKSISWTLGQRLAQGPSPEVDRRQHPVQGRPGDVPGGTQILDALWFFSSKAWPGTSPGSSHAGNPSFPFTPLSSGCLDSCLSLTKMPLCIIFPLTFPSETWEARGWFYKSKSW